MRKKETTLRQNISFPNLSTNAASSGKDAWPVDSLHGLLMVFGH